MNWNDLAREAAFLSRAASRMDASQNLVVADHADQLLTRVAQAINNPVQQQLQTLMFNVTQLNARLKQIEDSMSATNNAIKPAMAAEDAQSAQLTAIQSQQQSMQSELQQLNNTPSTTVNHQIGDYQVTVSPTL